ncbi:MAG TPA: hypothetical protein PLZ08_00250 [Bacillota bacterium]|jgi:antitoxin component of MazEF toxin-antitoxin module|nr:hypothetical protein [Bacillota bacterium]HOL08724.1 hypothetical protein [Bacillota bacterium]HPO96373.1 hypothetical protein [Bacillota bacterium]
MEYILELKNNQITLPESIINELELKPDTKFKATIKGGNLVIEYLPFSSQDQAKALERSINNLQH